MKEYTIYYTDTLNEHLYGPFETSVNAYSDKEYLELMRSLKNDEHVRNIRPWSSDGTFPDD